MSDPRDPIDGPDDLDDAELRSLVQRGAPAAPGDDAIVDARLDALRPQFRRARQRRQSAIAAVGAVAAVVVVVLAVGLVGREGTQQLDTADDRDTTTTTSTVAPTTTSVPVSTSTTSTIAPTTTAPAGRDAPSTTRGPEATTPTTVPRSRDTTTTTAAPAVPQTRSASSEGGSATFVWTPSQVSVSSTSPAAGWSVERVEQPEATRAIVRFRRDGGSGTSSATIDARVRDGRLEIQN